MPGPYTCDAKYREQYDPSKFTEGEQTMFGYITELDTAVGTIVQALEGSGKYNNSFVIFSSEYVAVHHACPSLHGGRLGDDCVIRDWLRQRARQILIEGA